MATTQPTVPLDETQFSMPEILHWHMQVMKGDWLDENIIHRYISESPFFDHSSKNGLIIDQSRNDQQAFQKVANRKLLEADLRGRKGVEFMIVGEPQPIKREDGEGVTKVEAGVGGNGMWVIRKQNRDKVQSGDGRWEEDLSVLGTYYLVGPNMYQAPSVADVVGNRLTAVANSLSRFYESAKNMPHFAVEGGYTYLPQHQSSSTAKGSSAQGSTAGTPSRSREGSVIPGADTQSLRSNSVLPDSQASLSQAQYQDTRLLAQTFRQNHEFSTDYLDENPLLGEPGNFNFTYSIQALKKRRQEAEAAERSEAEAAAKAKESQAASKVATPAAGKGVVEKGAEPPAVMTEKATKETKAKSGKVEKMRRKKSRHSIAPSTPVTPASAKGEGSAPGSAT